MTSTAKKNWKRMFSGPASGLLETDPEFAQFFADFAFDEVPLQDDLDDRSRMMAILAALIGSQSTETFEAMLPAALGLGVTPVEAREIVYQAAAYLGIGRTLPFLQAANRVFTASPCHCQRSPQLPRISVWNRASRSRWISLENRCVNFPSPARRRAATSIGGFHPTVLVTITPGLALITASVR